jgi:hypothetical protein
MNETYEQMMAVDTSHHYVLIGKIVNVAFCLYSGFFLQVLRKLYVVIVTLLLFYK